MSQSDTARTIIDAAHYVTIATADAEGRPWATPVWFAHDGYRDVVWISRPTTRHSRNVLRRNEIGMVFFDSTVAPGTGQGVYAEAVAHEAVDDLDEAFAIYSEGEDAAGIDRVAREKVTGDGPFRLYRARVEQLYLLGDTDERVPVEL